MIKYLILLFIGVATLFSVQHWRKEAVMNPPALGVEHRVVLTSDGFAPKELAIAKGDTVVFSTTAAREFWPASDHHPSHTAYPEFDPNQPLMANQSWSFTFHNVGTWGYHDHLYSFVGGSVTVHE